MHKRDKESVLITTLIEGHTITAACKRAGVSRMFYNRHYKDDAAFRAAVDDALSAGSDTNEDLINTVYRKKLHEGCWPAIHYALKKKDRLESKTPPTEFDLGDLQTIIGSLPRSQQPRYHALLRDLLHDAMEASRAGSLIPPDGLDL